jgi:predicted TIM-barrel fold metal-dependent hydrolase
MAEGRIISADSHFVEPPTMWAERVDKKFRDRAPHTERNINGKEGEFFVCENINPTPVAGFFGAGVPNEQVAEHNRKGFEAAPASVWDPAARLKDQDRDGVQAEVIYTSMGMPLYGLDDVGLRTACFSAYNDWAVEYCSHNPKRLLPLGLVTLEDIDSATNELVRIAKKGMKGAMIWAEPPDDRPYSHPDYDRFWAAAQDMNMPLSLHILTGRKGMGIDFFSSNLLIQGSTLHHQVERSIAVFVLGGVLERMDMIHARLGGLSAIKLSLKPSDYVKRQVYTTFINEPVFINELDRWGADNIMWSSDYPHLAATFPRSQEFVDKTFSGLPAEQRRKIVHDTAARVYGIAD